ncbi:hypothetical protein K7I13_03420 [Brucepastera parasyntrophica]|uniref:hypothetical protein n=1 Tax=Brucepastera parasyntrophica TaxID=2880008 RepID=UPI00210CE9A4|nr:hypothetical protein [Brucepastera parasyntrophica]ULQ60371.1 hypothetical protein K7I13_03420 [Brucepastera parasyntrophica]
MISRKDAIWSIGYDGNTAIVDKAARNRYGRLTTMQLAEAGFFRAAAASALYNESDTELADVTEVYNRISGSSYPVDAIPRLFGVARVNADKIKVL